MLTGTLLWKKNLHPLFFTSFLSPNKNATWSLFNFFFLIPQNQFVTLLEIGTKGYLLTDISIFTLTCLLFFFLFFFFFVSLSSFVFLSTKTKKKNPLYLSVHFGYQIIFSGGLEIRFPSHWIRHILNYPVKKSMNFCELINRSMMLSIWSLPSFSPLSLDSFCFFLRKKIIFYLVLNYKKDKCRTNHHHHPLSLYLFR